MTLKDYLVGEVTEDLADGLLTRREAIRRLTLLGLGVAGASALVAACSTDDNEAATTTTAAAQATTTAAAPAAAKSELITFDGKGTKLKGAWAAPATPKAALLVVHENRGLTPHFHELVGRFAGEGYAALCVDLISREGGTTAVDEAGAQASLGNATDEQLLDDLRSGLDELARRVPGKKLGTVGFCFGGGMVWLLLDAGEARLAAAAPFYGPAPEDANFSKAKAAVLAVYAEKDARVNASRDSAAAALRAARLIHEVKTYPGADHAFFNNTGARYNEAAAKQASADLLAWFGTHLA